MTSDEDLTGGIPDEFIRRDHALRISTERPAKRIDFPGSDGVAVQLWLLTEHELLEANLAAARYLRDTLKLTDAHLALLPDLPDETHKWHRLAVACRDPDDAELPFFRDEAAKNPKAPSVDKLRRSIDPDTREALWNEYLAFLDERSVISKATTLAEVEVTVDGLLKGSVSAVSLRSFDRGSLIAIASALVVRLQTLTSSNSSSGSPSSEPSSS